MCFLYSQSLKRIHHNFPNLQNFNNTLRYSCSWSLIWGGGGGEEEGGGGGGGGEEEEEEEERKKRKKGRKIKEKSYEGQSENKFMTLIFWVLYFELYWEHFRLNNTAITYFIS